MTVRILGYTEHHGSATVVPGPDNEPVGIIRATLEVAMDRQGLDMMRELLRREFGYPAARSAFTTVCPPQVEDTPVAALPASAHASRAALLPRRPTKLLSEG